MILIIDNYDSFTYNLVQLFQSRGAEIEIALNDKITIDEIRKLNPSGIVLSPGPCTPKEAGICLEVVKELKTEFPILGVCLGHQVIGEAFGAKVINAGRILHGKMEIIVHENKSIFANAKPMFSATRYHSLMIDKESITNNLEILATAKSDHIIMAVQHKEHPIFGVQFHPESYATECGIELADSFLNIIKVYMEGNYEHSKIS